MYGFEDEEKTRDKTNDVEDNNFIPTNIKQKYTNKNLYFSKKIIYM